MGRKSGDFSILTARVHPEADARLPSVKKIGSFLRARREDYAELWALTDLARALKLVHPSWIAERAGRRGGIGHLQKLRLMRRYVEGYRGVSAPFITRRWAQELKSALIASGIADNGFPVADLGGLQQRLGIEPPAAVDVAPRVVEAAPPPAPPPPPAPVAGPVESLAGQIQQILYGSGAARARRLDEIAQHYCGVYDLICREQNDGEGRDAAFATRSLLIVHEVEGESGPEHLVCELVAYLPPGAVARAYLARAGYAFRVADACVCLLFDAASMPAFLTTDDGKALKVVPRPSVSGMKTLFLAPLSPGSPYMRVTHQTATLAGVGVARRRAPVLQNGLVRVGYEDLRALRRLRMNGVAEPSENELIQLARQFPLLHATEEAAPASPRFAGLRR